MDESWIYIYFVGIDWLLTLIAVITQKDETGCFHIVSLYKGSKLRLIAKVAELSFALFCGALIVGLIIVSALSRSGFFSYSRGFLFNVLYVIYDWIFVTLIIFMPIIVSWYLSNQYFKKEIQKNVIALLPIEFRSSR